MDGAFEDQLDPLLGKLKRALIDAYMVTEWRPNAEIAASTYTYEKSVLLAMSGPSGSYRATISRPGANGEGGGVFTVERTDTHYQDLEMPDEAGMTARIQTAFGDIRASVEDLFKPWRSLPNPVDIEAVGQDAALLAGRLDVQADGSGTGVNGSSSMTGWIADIHRYSAGMSGGAWDAFRLNFLLQLPRIIGAHHELATVLGAAAMGEAAMWRESRDAVLTTVEKATASAEALAEKQGVSDWGFSANVVGWVWAAIAAFLGAPASAGVALVTLAVTVFEDIHDVAAKPMGGSGASVTSIVQSLTDQLGALNAGIRTVELELSEGLVRVQARLAAHPELVDLTPQPIATTDGMRLQTTFDDMNMVYSSLMPYVSDELHSIGSAVDELRLRAAVTRYDAIGSGNLGPADEWQAVKVVLYELVKNLAHEVEVHTESVELAVNDMRAHEEATAAALAQYAAEVSDDEGGTSNPWTPIAPATP